MAPKPKENIHSIGISNKDLAKTQLQRLPKPIKAIRERGNQLLDTLLQSFFSETDDQLFDLAKNSINQADQDDFFSAMREIRAKQSTVKSRFFDFINQAYADLNQPPESESSVKRMNKISADELTLIGFDDLDELVAKESLISRAQAGNKRLLRELSHRIDSVVMADADEFNLPVAPKNLTDSFVAAVHTIDISTKAMMVFFKIFESEMLNKLGSLYQLQNKMLIDRGIFPRRETTPTPQVQPTTQASQPSQPLVDGMDLPLDPEFDAALFASNPYAAPPTTNATPAQITGNTAIAGSGYRPGTGGSNVQHPSNQGSPSRPRHSYVAASTDGQLHRVLQKVRKLGLSGKSQRTGNRAQHLQQLIRHAEVELNQEFSLNPEETRFVSLMDGLFNNLQNSLSVPQEATDLLSHLQLPLVDIALRDHSFLSNPNHAARSLLNKVTEALVYCEGQNPEQLVSDPLFQKVEGIVQNIASLSKATESDYKAASYDLDNFRRNEDQRSKIFEKRLYGSELGRLKNEEAERLVKQTITEACQGMAIHPAVKDIIKLGWKNVMTFVALKYGSESQQWDECIQVLIDLVLGTQEFTNEQELKEAARAMRDVKARLKSGFEEIYFDHFTMEELFQRLDKTMMALAKRLRNKAEVVAAPTRKPAVNLSVKKVMTQVDETIQAADTLSDPGLQPYINQAKCFGRGAWFSLKVDNEWVRCRLAAIIEDYDNYIFVNRHGQKVVDLNIKSIAEKLKSEEIKPMDSNQIFEKALEQVIGGIQKKHRPK